MLEQPLSPVARTVVESDCHYFELAAETEDLPGATLAYMPGLESLASASVVQRVEPERVDRPLPDWLALLESRARSLKLSHLRIYLMFERPEWADVLNANGFIRREEILLQAPVVPCTASKGVLVPVQSPQDWEERVAVFQGGEKGADGYLLSCRDWNEMERRKAATGCFHLFNVWSKEATVGTVGYFKMGDFVRIKNVYVRPSWRGCGMGRNIVMAMRSQAWSLHARDVGVMAVAGGPATALYQKCGLRSVGAQYEWMKGL